MSRLLGGRVGVLAGYECLFIVRHRETHLSVEVERDGLVGNLHIGDLDDNLLELIMVPIGKSLSH